MTVCTAMEDAVKRRIDDGQTVTEIGQALCSGLKHPDRKVIRAIKNIPELREKLYNDDDWSKQIGYDNSALKRAAKRKKSNKKQQAEESQNIAIPDNRKNRLKEAIKEFIENYNRDNKRGALTVINNGMENIKLVKQCLKYDYLFDMLVDWSDEYPDSWKKVATECINEVKSNTDTEGST